VGVLRDLLAHLVHVELLDLIDDRLEGLRGQRARLAEQQHAVAEHHDRRDRRDADRLRQILLGLGVDLAEHHVGVLLGGLLEHRREHLAGTTPLGPEVEQHDAGLLDDLLEVVDGDLDGARTHERPLGRRCVCPGRSRARATL